MPRTIRLIVFSLGALCTLSVRAQTVVPMTSEPSHHLTISNEYVRAFKVEVARHAETLYHKHDYDYIYVTIGDADVNSVRIHEQPVHLQLKDGQVEFSKAPFAHTAQNNSDRPFRNVTIELLKGIGTPICGIQGAQQSCGTGVGWADGTCDGACGSEVPILRGSLISVDEFSVQAGRQIPKRMLPRPPFLLVAVSNARFRLASQKGTQELAAGPGDVFWNEDAIKSFTPLRSAAKFVVLSFAAQKTQ